MHLFTTDRAPTDSTPSRLESQWAELGSQESGEFMVGHTTKELSPLVRVKSYPRVR